MIRRLVSVTMVGSRKSVGLEWEGAFVNGALLLSHLSF